MKEGFPVRPCPGEAWHLSREAVYILRSASWEETCPAHRPGGGNELGGGPGRHGKAATLAEPLLVLVSGLAVGFVVIAVLLPIFDLSSLAG